jgi:Ycf66 protein N-terminus
MLSYILAIVVGAGSLGLYLAAFLFPELHRKYDLVWSGIGLFYGLTLWVCAGRITGAVLLGQMASVTLLGGLGWQTLTLRLAQTPAELRTELPADSAQDVFQITIRQLRANLSQSAERSTLTAQLDQAIARLETAWDSLQRWFQSLSTEHPPQSGLEPLSKLDLNNADGQTRPPQVLHPTPLSSERDLGKGGSSE